MLRQQIIALIQKSIGEKIPLEDYSSIYYRIRIADNFTEGGIWYTKDNSPNVDYYMGYPDSLLFFEIYNAAILTDERFNNIEIRFNKEMNAEAVFTWDQNFYDEDVKGNKKYKKKKSKSHLLTEFEIQYLNPIHHEYPAWAGDERWLQLYRLQSGSQIVLTRGLSDGKSNPYEIYLETDDTIEVDSFSSSWQANLVYETGRILPNVRNIVQRLEKNLYLTLQLEMEDAPPEWSLNNPDGNIGLFAGLKNILADQLAGSFTPLNIKLMRPEELQFAIENDYEGRLKLAALYKMQGSATISNIERKSVI